MLRSNSGISKVAAAMIAVIVIIALIIGVYYATLSPGPTPTPATPTPTTPTPTTPTPSTPTPTTPTPSTPTPTTPTPTPSTPTPTTPTPSTPTPTTPTPSTPTPTTPTPGPEKIKVGMIASLTGALASIGRIQKVVVEEVVKMFNSEGGIYLKDYGRKLPIDLILVDDESNPSRATELAMRLVSDQELVAVVCCSYAHISTPVAKLTERYSVSLLSAGAPVEFFAAAGPWNYSWIHSTSFEKDCECFLDLLSEYRSQTNQKVALVMGDDIVGRTQHKLLIPKLEREGYTIFDTGLYPPETADFASIILKLKDAGCDILFVQATPSTFAVFWRQCALFSYKPKLLWNGAISRPEDVQVLGSELGLGIMASIAWHPDFPFPLSATYREIWEKYSKQGFDLGPTGAYYFTIWFVLKDALERVGRLDRQALNKAIGETKIVGACGPVSFDPQTHTSAAYTTLGQWQKTAEGKLVLQPVWSEIVEIEVVKLIFPLP
ncbi:MAG: ABC transporter substrate-binding protein [Candidatus Bathyarchaeia archaeon]